MNTHTDHLVIAARTLEQGVEWARERIGITPGPGGSHPRYGTHNRLFKIATPTFPWAYLEIIAIDPQAAPPAQARWFDLDNPTLQAAVAEEPRLVHWVVNTDDIQAALIAWQALGLDRGPAVPASRNTADGLLQWQITVRDDGLRLMDGTLPSLIQWGAADDTQPLRLHPRQKLPRSGVSLAKVSLTHPQAGLLKTALNAVGLGNIEVTPGAPNLMATLRTPKGEVRLQSLGI
jgi:Glyoxalase-like domain